MEEEHVKREMNLLQALELEKVDDLRWVLDFSSCIEARISRD